jgi:hypothetical protein
MPIHSWVYSQHQFICLSYSTIKASLVSLYHVLTQLHITPYTTFAFSLLAPKPKIKILKRSYVLSFGFSHYSFYFFL